MDAQNNKVTKELRCNNLDILKAKYLPKAWALEQKERRIK